MRLRRSKLDVPGISRKRRGKGFCFPAKGVITTESDVDNAAVAALIKALLRRDDDDPEVKHVNAYTWHGVTIAPGSADPWQRAERAVLKLLSRN